VDSVSLETWIAFCLTEAALCLTPGPAVLLVISFSISRGARAGLQAGVGILTANMGYFALSALGVGAVLIASWELFVLIKWAGAAYLVYLGICLLVSSVGANSKVEPSRPGASSPMVRGFVAQAANPKSIVFFTALLPQFLHVDSPMAPQVLILGASSVLIELVVLTGYALASARARQWAGDRLQVPLQRIGGLFLVGAGARLAAIRSGHD